MPPAERVSTVKTKLRTHEYSRGTDPKNPGYLVIPLFGTAPKKWEELKLATFP